MPLSKLQNGAKHTYSQVLVYMKAFEFKVFLKNEKITLLGGGANVTALGVWDEHA